ncbi:helix-turn-helix domain-containing protein [Runella sp.]|uniref:helix-turn-helix domain-containing protein n=1 Tax=Runella sp. TaxID=1960881 RepID=UPI003D10D982
MNNPFAEIYERLGNIEGFLLALNEKLTTTPPQPTDDKLYLSAKEAAEFMGIKLQTLYQNIERVPHVKKHGKLLFTRDGLISYIEQK